MKVSKREQFLLVTNLFRFSTENESSFDSSLQDICFQDTISSNPKCILNRSIHSFLKVRLKITDLYCKFDAKKNMIITCMNKFLARIFEINSKIMRVGSCSIKYLL